MNESTQLRPGVIYAGVKPIRDPKYKQFVKMFPCCACAKTWWIDPCHCPHGGNQKSCDRSCIPLCRTCHAAFDASPIKFADVHVWSCGAPPSVPMPVCPDLYALMMIQDNVGELVKACKQHKLTCPKCNPVLPLPAKREPTGEPVKIIPEAA